MDGNIVEIDGDVLFIRASGSLTETSAIWLVQLLQRVVSRQGRLYVLGDLKDAGGIPPQSRRILIEFGKKHVAGAIAFYRASYFIRGVNALLFGALNVIGKRPQNMRHFSTEQEARTWLESERQRLRNQPRQ